MFNKLKNLKEHINQGRNAFTFDASRFNDPLAEQIHWTPLTSGGSSFQSHFLEDINSERMEYRQTKISKAFGFVFSIVGIAIPIVALTIIDFSDPNAIMNLAFSSLIGLTFIAGGFFANRKSSFPVVFDKSSGNFWKGAKKPEDDSEPSNSENIHKLNNVHAIQLVAEYVKSENKSYYMYEMNFVMNDTKRLNIMRHGGKKALRQDAEKMSEFLSKPVWDAAG